MQVLRSMGMNGKWQKQIKVVRIMGKNWNRIFGCCVVLETGSGTGARERRQLVRLRAPEAYI
jgi:hypothetical protein